MRIAQFLAHCGVASRRASEKLITQGEVFINDVLVTKLHTQIDIDNDKVVCQGKKLRLERSCYMILNKPVGYLCTHQDSKGRSLIYELVPKTERLFSVGRLDYNSEGLILLTNDGEFSQMMTHPSYKIQKKYRVRVKATVTSSQLHKLRLKGITYKGKHYTVKSVSIKTSSSRTTTLNFTLTEGKKNEIRKICAALNLPVLVLKRIQIAQIRLGQLPLGSYRNLTQQEVRKLKKIAQNATR